MPSRTLPKGSAKPQPSTYIFKYRIFKCFVLTVAASAAEDENSSEETKKGGHPLHFVSWPATFRKKKTRATHLTKIYMLNTSWALNFSVLKSWNQFPCYWCHLVAFSFTNQTTTTAIWGRFTALLFSCPPLLSDVLALGNREYKGQQIQSMNHSLKQILLQLYEGTVKILGLTASFGKIIL